MTLAVSHSHSLAFVQCVSSHRSVIYRCIPRYPPTRGAAYCIWTPPCGFIVLYPPRNLNEYLIDGTSLLLLNNRREIDKGARCSVADKRELKGERGASTLPLRVSCCHHRSVLTDTLPTHITKAQSRRSFVISMSRTASTRDTSSRLRVGSVWGWHE